MLSTQALVGGYGKFLTHHSYRLSIFSFPKQITPSKYGWGFLFYNVLMKVLLDNVDITADLNAQYPLPQSVASGGIFPDTSGSRWWDLAKCISAHPELKDYFNGGVHVMQIIDNGQAFKVKMLLRAKYTSRNA